VTAALIACGADSGQPGSGGINLGKYAKNHIDFPTKNLVNSRVIACEPGNAANLMSINPYS
jgi:hypothetical protein